MTATALAMMCTLCSRTLAKAFRLAERTQTPTFLPRKRSFVSDYTQADEDARDAARAAADSLRADANLAAYVGNIRDVGDAYVGHAGALGDIGVTLATEGSDAHLTFVSDENTATTGYVTSLGGADSQLLGLVSQAEVGASVALANFGIATTSSIGTATTALMTAWGTAYVTRTTSIAAAETDYQVGTTADQATRWATYAAATNTPLSGFQAAEAAAYAQWVAEMEGEMGSGTFLAASSVRCAGCHATDTAQQLANK